MNIKIPNAAEKIINTLEQNGYEAYVVGGCVRDSLLGANPKDWDICTNALPQQTIDCFGGYRIIETGLQHGTITIMIDFEPYEVTTYRLDGEYLDNRRPSKVQFINSLKDDLSRRDFTINSMAYNNSKGLIDYFGGAEDLKGKIIRCVGDADLRFQEDALRIMRALRFASVLGFDIDDKTKHAIFKNKSLLSNIAVERVSSELNKLIVGECAYTIMMDFREIFEHFIPEINALVGFEQNHPYHCLDVWGHTLSSINEVHNDVILKLTMLFHDIAKPKCYTENEGIGHFYGHPQHSSDMAVEILKRLKYDNNTISQVRELVFYHDVDIKPKRSQIKRLLNKVGEDMH